jgi:ribosomal protein S18 acetylase RimI-like enzyme
MQTEIVEADLTRAEHREAVRALTASYALDPMGNDGPLPAEVLDRLASFPTTVILLAYVEGTAVGIATCFRGFSTFRAQPRLNLHDLAVLPDQRGRGVGQQLLAAVASKARALGCCKVTLEVQENNMAARRAYERAGFATATCGQGTGSLFLAKPL